LLHGLGCERFLAFSTFSPLLSPALFAVANRGDKIRTCDLLVPNQALYQAELRPGNFARATLCRLDQTDCQAGQRRSVALAGATLCSIAPHANHAGAKRTRAAPDRAASHSQSSGLSIPRRLKCHALTVAHPSVCTSIDTTGGRSRTIADQWLPPSADAYTWPPVVPK
jgi:hypothetical protein